MSKRNIQNSSYNLFPNFNLYICFLVNFLLINSNIFFHLVSGCEEQTETATHLLLGCLEWG